MLQGLETRPRQVTMFRSESADN